MADPVKSVLLVDFDSMHRRLDATDPGAGDRFALGVAAWIDALEKGKLLKPRQKRQIMVRRCFADPDILGHGSVALTSAGFDVIETPQTASSRSAAEVHLTIDAIDALSDKAHFEEFILLSASANFAPLLMRLKASGRRTVIYADDEPEPEEDVLADAVLSRSDLAKLIAPQDDDDRAIDRAAVEAFARRIAGETSVPLLAPRTYGELFRRLAEEIGRNGYDFQNTAKSVADQLSADGRNIARRQVVFVVKGLALKGHVFSTDDTPSLLARVFREQARYLISNAGISLSAHEERLLNAWLVDRAARDENEAKAAKRATKKPKPVKTKARTKAPKPAPPTEARKPAKKAPAAAPSTAPEPAEEAAGATEAPRRIRSAEEVKAEIAARIANSVREKRAADEAGEPASRKPRKPRRKKAAPEEAPSTEKAPAADTAPPPSAESSASDSSNSAGSEGDPLESSILAAIAEAVDVLVDTDTELDEDSPAEIEAGTQDAFDAETNVAEEAAAEPAFNDDTDPVVADTLKAVEAALDEHVEAPQTDSQSGDDGDDIGDEIQRIIASYDRERKAEPDQG